MAHASDEHLPTEETPGEAREQAAAPLPEPAAEAKPDRADTGTRTYRSAAKKRFTERHNLPGYGLAYLLICGALAHVALVVWLVRGWLYGF